MLVLRDKPMPVLTPARRLRSYCAQGVGSDGRFGPQPLVLVFDQLAPEPGPGQRARRAALDRQEARLLAHALYSSLSGALYEALIEALPAMRDEHAAQVARDRQRISNG